MADKQHKAWLNLFQAIVEENGYYTELRRFMKKNGFTIEDFAKSLYRYYDYAPEGMSVYYYLDSIEDALPDIKKVGGISTVGEVVDFIYDNQIWKE